MLDQYTVEIHLMNYFFEFERHKCINVITYVMKGTNNRNTQFFCY